MSVPEELFQRVESERFAALVNVASNLKTFLRALDAQPEVRELGAALATPEVRLAVLGRVTELTGRATDPGYEHPADSALAAYLWLLSRDDAVSAVAAAEKVEGCPGCWWAKKVAGAVRAAAPGSLDGNGVGRTGKDWSGTESPTGTGRGTL
jgi:hypothetical protein